ncbi:MAG: methyltransferase [Candidatus Eisenbacteria bacterium]|nr:methyltransferase [Candidatus Eisenbacteria bacterium]
MTTDPARAAAVPAPPAVPAPGPAGARAAFERFLRWTVDEEYAALPARLPDGEREAFVRYYQRLPRPGDAPAMRPFLRGQWRGDAGWVARWLAARRAPRVLDAGSGFGTFSMLYASVGADVVGVDLRPDRLDAAERRLAFHRERTGIALPVRYERGDLTREWPGTFDLVWVYNALSHIDPLDPFIAGVRDHLRPGGVLVVGDINGAHPEHLARLATLRDEVHQQYVAPDGTRHAYAVERPFPPAELRAVVERNGLAVERHELYWRGMAQVPDPLYALAMAPLQRAWRLGARFARRQMLVAGLARSAAS